MEQSGSDSDLSAPPSDLEINTTFAAHIQETIVQAGSQACASTISAGKRKREVNEPVRLSSKRSKAADGTRSLNGTRATGSTTEDTSKQGLSSRSQLRKKAGPIQTANVKTQDQTDAANEKPSTDNVIAKSQRRKAPKTPTANVKLEDTRVLEQEHNGAASTKVKQKRKIKTKEEKEAEMIPLAPRSLGSKLLIGAHVSSAGGVQNAVVNSVHIGGNAFALFLKSQRKWANPPLAEDHLKLFIEGCADHKYEASKHIVPHGSYLVNLCHPDPQRTSQAYDAFLDDLSRCRSLGIQLYNFHPGNSAGAESREQAIQHLATQLNKAHSDRASGNVITLLETMATRGNTIGGTFEDLRDAIQHVTNKQRVGACLDTCHIFAAGYDIRTAAGLTSVLDEFDRTIGMQYLRALHINDSKAPLASNRDLHANIGTGFLGLRAFHALVNEPRLWGLPMVLETPIDAKDKDGKEIQDKNVWAQEIKLMERMVGMDVESEEFIKLEQSLKAKGLTERERIADQVRRKEEKLKNPKKSRGKKKKDAGHDDSGDDST